MLFYIGTEKHSQLLVPTSHPHTPKTNHLSIGKIAGSELYRGCISFVRNKWSLRANSVLTGLHTKGFRPLVGPKTETEMALNPGEIDLPPNRALVGPSPELVSPLKKWP